MKSLAQVEDSFAIDRLGVVIAPAFAAPDRFTTYQGMAEVHRPDGNVLNLEINLMLNHFRFNNGGSGYRVVASFPSASKEDIPPGSRILVDDAAPALVEHR